MEQQGGRELSEIIIEKISREVLLQICYSLRWEQVHRGGVIGHYKIEEEIRFGIPHQDLQDL